MPAKKSPAKTPAPPVRRYQLKITLVDSNPSIWRQVIVPEDVPLDYVHHIIQLAMGWENDHMHEIVTGTTRANRVRYSVIDPDFGFAENEVLDEEEHTLAEIAPRAKRKFFYEYDFGDGWLHEVVVEKVLPPDPLLKQPLCIAGANACPPEDCGGISGYYRLVDILADPKDPEYEETREWLGKKFDPEAFDCVAANKRLKWIKL
ncbi:hypothetical protein LBMAG56_49530 [Verrucomicrobiota bacterium]|nr:hypothetical protein LBMAG56_49530 [Verrucomicrobiota bacterium]